MATSASPAAQPRSLADILPPHWKDTVRDYIRDDAPTFDVGGYVVGSAVETAVLLAKTATVLAGVPFFTEVFESLGCTVEWLAAEGAVLTPPAKVALVRGPCRALLLGERTALNILSRASGIAASARELVELAKAAAWHGEVAGTRKVTPGFRLIEKYALLVGGASTHRMDLSSMVMLKDNHVWATGSISLAVKAARRVAGFSSKIEVECRTLDEALEAAGAGAEVIMLDNYSPAEMATQAAALKARYPHVTVEASGGITRATLAQYFHPSIDVVSMGALTHGYAVADFSLKIEKGAGAAAIARTVAAARSS